MSSWAKPGVKCVCIGGWTEPNVDDLPNPPIVGKVYTIRETITHPTTGELYVFLVEVRNMGWFEECRYHSDRFRPLVSDKTEAEDVALFKRLLDAPVDA